MQDFAKIKTAIASELENRILVIDGAMGSLIQTYNLTEEDFRGDRFADWHIPLKGNNEVLNLTRPDVIEDIHTRYLEAGADLIGTNTFNGTSVSQGDYEMEALAYEFNLEGARIARTAADKVGAQTPDRPRYVIGALGPMNKTLSMSVDVNDPGARSITFDEVLASYKEAARGLIEGGADILAVETIFDTLNSKAAIVALGEIQDELQVELPIMISGTITDQSGRTLSGQTVEAFWNSVSHIDPICAGLNCSLGAELMRPYIADISRVATVPVSAYPNAGLPNEFGGFDETPDSMASHLKEWAEAGFVNLVGGCCGSTPEHIKAVADAVSNLPPRHIPEVKRAMRLSGLEALEVA